MSNTVPVPAANHRSWRALVLLVSAGLALSACDRNIEPYDAEAEVRQPDLSKIFPPQAGQSSPGQVIGMGGVERGAASPQAADTAASPANAAEPIQGTVDIADGLKPPDGATLFVIARNAGAVGGPPLAAQRIPATGFPASFSIGPENVMIPSMRFEGDIQLTARLDSDGNAMTRTPGDLQGTAAKSVQPGGRVDIVLDEQI